MTQPPVKKKDEKIVDPKAAAEMLESYKNYVQDLFGEKIVGAIYVSESGNAVLAQVEPGFEDLVLSKLPQIAREVRKAKELRAKKKVSNADEEEIVRMTLREVFKVLSSEEIDSLLRKLQEDKDKNNDDDEDKEDE